MTVYSTIRHTHTVTRTFHNAEPLPRPAPKPRAADLAAEVLRLAAEGISPTAISRRLDVGRTTVYRILSAERQRGYAAERQRAARAEAEAEAARKAEAEFDAADDAQNALFDHIELPHETLARIRHLVRTLAGIQGCRANPPEVVAEFEKVIWRDIGKLIYDDAAM